ncbi:MAG: hypothetical protein GY711_28780 [bacterium]|nr:hypothetical protein [bacterium]
MDTDPQPAELAIDPLDAPGGLARLVATIERRFADARRTEALELDPAWKVATTPWSQVLVAYGAPLAAFAVLAGFAAPGWSGLALLVLAALLAVVVACALLWSVLRVRRVRREGVAVPAVVLQAHESTWEPGEDAGSTVAQVLFSFDESVRRAPLRLVELAEEMRARVHGADPLLAPKLRSKIETGRVDFRRFPLPTEITGGALCYLADVTLVRERLPAGHLDRSLLFCVAHPELARAGIELLPLEAWWRPAENALTVL